MKVAVHGDTNKLYACEIRRSDQFERKIGGGYDEEEFNEAHETREITRDEERDFLAEIGTPGYDI